jgi:hypothetical protein
MAAFAFRWAVFALVLACVGSTRVGGDTTAGVVGARVDVVGVATLDVGPFVVVFLAGVDRGGVDF